MLLMGPNEPLQCKSSDHRGLYALYMQKLKYGHLRSATAHRAIGISNSGCGAPPPFHLALLGFEYSAQQKWILFGADYMLIEGHEKAGELTSTSGCIFSSNIILFTVLWKQLYYKIFCWSIRLCMSHTNAEVE